MHLPWLEEDDYLFPPTEEALTTPNGLLAAGGDLSPERLIRAYAQGIFPWFSEDEPVLWWTPDPRCILNPNEFHASKSLRKLSRKNTYQVRCNVNFPEVIEHCSKERATQDGTWITEDMKEAYHNLHHLGFAHSVEVYREDNLVGGLYGIGIGKVFYGESMFSLEANASKLALYHLSNHFVTNKYKLIDCQVTSEHLLSLGAKEISREAFESILCANLNSTGLTPLELPPRLTLSE
ncbi:leucyl/phenylalanyl-tRNA--protein transferase [Litoribacillus peritrichatus]|uniref:Leucyl/phenylalanyl-tRNA--protein transferase n=1 Tax=Litoribacillus peritrichatus TaxID=718191 RepID=A0ABP7N172_9GAMM